MKTYILKLIHFTYCLSLFSCEKITFPPLSFNETSIPKIEKPSKDFLEGIYSYDYIKLLGQGKQGKVHLIDLKSRFIGLVATKEVNITRESDEFTHESTILRLCESKGIPQYYGYKNGFLLFEYVDGLDLEQYFEHHKGEDKNQTLLDLLNFGLQTLDILQYLHQEKHIIHNDIHEANIMVLENKSIKLIDFGSSKIFTKSEVSNNKNEEFFRYTKSEVAMLIYSLHNLVSKYHLPKNKLLSAIFDEAIQEGYQANTASNLSRKYYKKLFNLKESFKIELSKKEAKP